MVMGLTRTSALLAGVASLGLGAPAAQAVTMDGLFLNFAEAGGQTSVTLSGSIFVPTDISGDDIFGEPQVNPAGETILAYDTSTEVEPNGNGDLIPSAIAEPVQFFQLFDIVGFSPFVSGGDATLFSEWTGDAIYVDLSADGQRLGIVPQRANGNNGNINGIVPRELDVPIFVERLLSGFGTLDATLDELGVAPGVFTYAIEFDEFANGGNNGDDLFNGFEQFSGSVMERADVPPPDLTITFTRRDTPDVIPVPAALPLMLGGLGLLGVMGWRRRRG